MITVEKLEEEANKQLAGIKIITIIGMIIWFGFWIMAVVGSISMAISLDLIEGLSMFLTLTLLFGGLTVLNLMSFLGLLRRKAYAVPICRAVLWINAGLIFLIILWPRLNKPLVKWYLNYGSIDIKEAEKEIPIGKVEETKIYTNNVNEKKPDNCYCCYCGNKLTNRALFCDQCGNKIS